MRTNMPPARRSRGTRRIQDPDRRCRVLAAARTRRGVFSTPLSFVRRLSFARSLHTWLNRVVRATHLLQDFSFGLFTFCYWLIIVLHILHTLQTLHFHSQVLHDREMAETVELNKNVVKKKRSGHPTSLPLGPSQMLLLSPLTSSCTTTLLF